MSTATAGWAILGGLFFAGSCWANARAAQRLADALALNVLARKQLNKAVEHAVEARVQWACVSAKAEEVIEAAGVIRAVYPEFGDQ